MSARRVLPVTTLGLTSLMPVYSDHAPDVTWDLVPGVKWGQAMIFLSIITACTPTIKSSLTDITSDVVAVNIPEHLELTGQGGSASHAEKGSSSQNTLLGPYGLGQWPRSSTKTSAIDESGVGRTQSRERLTGNVIIQTTDYTVEYETEQDVPKSAYGGSPM